MTRTTRDDGEVDLLDQYCQEVARYQVLDAYTCAMLAQKAQRGDTLARTDLVHANLRLVIPLAREATRTILAGCDLMDLINIGNMALMSCIDAYRWYTGAVSFMAWGCDAVRFAYMTEAHRVARIVPTVSLDEFGDVRAPVVHPDPIAEARYDQLLATARWILTEREYFVLTRLGDLEPGEGKWTHREVATALGLHNRTPNKIRKRAAAKLQPYFAAYLSASSAAVLSSGARAQPPGKRTPAAIASPAPTRSDTAGTTDSAAQALLTAAPSISQSAQSDSKTRLPSARRRADGGPLPLSMRKSSAQRGRESNQTEKKTA